MLVTLAGRVRFLTSAAPQNASSPILVTALPMVMDARLLHCLNVYSLMVVTLSGIVTDARLLHP